jgi:hypothetical protein
MMEEVDGVCQEVGPEEDDGSERSWTLEEGLVIRAAMIEEVDSLFDKKGTNKRWRN